MVDRRTIRIGLGVLLAAMVGPAPTCAAAKTPHPATVQRPQHNVDQFVATAAGRSLAGIELSELALQRSESPAVRRLARRAHDETAHTFDTLLALATGAGISAAPPETIDLEQRAIKSRLAGLHGPAFDRAYVAALRTNDDRDIALYRGYARDGHDAAFASWVQDQLTTIRKRRQLIEATDREISSAR
jgi:putative membrane protein